MVYIRWLKTCPHFFLLIAILIFTDGCNSKDGKAAKNKALNDSHNSKSSHFSQFKETEYKPVWSNAMFNPEISQAIIYNQLDQQEEIYDVFEIPETLTKRTSDVKYSTGQNMNAGQFNNLKVNNCRAFLYQSDTLYINIGISNGFSGQGFLIKYNNKKFYTEPYYHTDIVIPDEPIPKFKIVYQNLTLNKLIYKPGDSLYGNIDFKSIEIRKDNKTIEHWGKGYFRAMVIKP